MQIKCACKDSECRTSIHFDAGSSAIWFTDKNGEETIMYLDANAIIDLINELRSILHYLAGDRAG